MNLKIKMRGPIHRVIVWYLRRCAGAFHMFPYGPEGRYVVLMNEDQYHYYGNCARWLEGVEKAKKMWFEKAKKRSAERDSARAWSRAWKAKAKDSRGIIETFSNKDLFDAFAAAVIDTQKRQIDEYRQFLREVNDWVKINPEWDLFQEPPWYERLLSLVENSAHNGN